MMHERETEIQGRTKGVRVKSIDYKGSHNCPTIYDDKQLPSTYTLERESKYDLLKRLSLQVAL
jgi:hypothetical protein